ncbi:hypothetical protein K440DRAFT_638745 [Wilcoxina mikolae CBS 423.85]|nr:hypothetical protein K440DRAFT_638745 [Wilcoxina mikolae CBS 423.85]
MTSHGAIAPRIQEKKIGENIKKHGFWNRYLTKFLGRSENDRSESQQPKDSTKWWEGVEIYAAGTDKKVGDLCKTYDEEASEDTIYPIGFPYDISLIRPAQNKRMIGGIISPASEWYRDGALDTKSRLYVVGSHQIDGHGLPRRWSEPVGQGIMLNQGGLLPEQKWKADDVKRLVSRCTLWRPLNATAGWDGWSGAPVIVKKEDGTEALLGFQSFVQDSHHRQFPMPDDKLKEACTDGYISFGACMRLPEDVLNSVIVR